MERYGKVLEKPLVVGFYGGPGSGKSTAAAGLYYELKRLGLEVELVQEFAKEVVYLEDWHTLSNQIYIFAKQHYRQWKFTGKVDVIITDCPFVMGLAYTKDEDVELRELVVAEYAKWPSLNYFLPRLWDYNGNGRKESESEAADVDVKILSNFQRHSVTYVELPEGYAPAAESVVREVVSAVEALRRAS